MNIYDTLAAKWKMSRHDAKKQVYAAVFNLLKEPKRTSVLKDVYILTLKEERK